MPNTTVVGIIFPYILTPIPNLYDHSFPRYGQITFLTFRRPTTLTFDLKFWKYLSVTVYPYVICMPSFIMIGWEMAEILHFEILRKHGQTNTQTHTQTDMGITIPRPPPMGGEVIIRIYTWYSINWNELEIHKDDKDVCESYVFISLCGFMIHLSMICPWSICLNLQKYEYWNLIVNLNMAPIYVKCVKITLFTLASMGLHDEIV